MFDRKRLEAFLDSLDTEIHFPSQAPKKIIVDMAPQSALAAKMDKYDLFVQGNFNYNHGTSKFPVYGPTPTAPYVPSWLWSGSYGSINRTQFVMTNIQAPEVPSVPVETPHSRLKGKISRLATATSASISDPAPPAPSRSPDFVHTITAWRGWQVTSGILEALGTDSKWEPKRAPRANCFGGDHPAPRMACNCGYWSFKTLDLLQEALAAYACSVDVIGQVEIWGRVIECENGFRSEFAYPKELWLLDEGLESLSWRYGVPVRKLG